MTERSIGTAFVPNHGLWRRRGERWIFAFAVGTIALVALGHAALSIFFYDELVTLHASELGSARTIAAFFQSGKDTTSYLPALLVYAARHMHGRPEVTARLPFIVAFAGTCCFFFGFLRRRYAAGYALAGTMLLVLGYTFEVSYEIRAYGFVLLGTAFAAYCWQLANEDQPRRGLAAIGVFAGLGTAIAFHLFALFVLIPFAFAQGVHDWQLSRSARRKSWPVWVALVVAPVCAVAEVRGALAAKLVYGPSFWAKPNLLNFIDTYRIFGTSLVEIMDVLLVILAILVWLRKSGRLEALRRREGSPGTGFSAAEWTLQFGFLFLPMAVAVLSMPLGVYRAKYVLAFFLGAATLMAALVAECMRRSTTVGWGLAVCLLGLFLVHNDDAIVPGLNTLTGRPVQPWALQTDWFETARKINLPVVVNNAHYFLEMHDYGPTDLQSRMHYLTSRAHAEKYPWAMTSELNMEIFAPEFRLPVEDFDSFTRANPRFLLVSDPGQTWDEWNLHYLMAMMEAGGGERLTLVAQQQGYSNEDVYLVEMTPNSK